MWTNSLRYGFVTISSPFLIDVCFSSVFWRMMYCLLRSFVLFYVVRNVLFKWFIDSTGWIVLRNWCGKRNETLLLSTVKMSQFHPRGNWLLCRLGWINFIHKKRIDENSGYLCPAFKLAVKATFWQAEHTPTNRPHGRTQPLGSSWEWTLHWFSHFDSMPSTSLSVSFTSFIG